jgi:hypothetical protein
MRIQCVANQAVIFTDGRETEHPMASQLAVMKCLGCGKPHKATLKVPRGGSRLRNWSVAGYCCDCRPGYEAFLRNSDDASRGMRLVAEEIMEGWNASRQPHLIRPRVPAEWMCRSPRAALLAAEFVRP